MGTKYERDRQAAFVAALWSGLLKIDNISLKIRQERGALVLICAIGDRSLTRYVSNVELVHARSMEAFAESYGRAFADRFQEPF